MSERPRPQFSYVQLPGGKVTVTCTCGWKDPLGPVFPSAFDPLESLVAASAVHFHCPELASGESLAADLQR